ncbi:MAG: 5'-3' exonuclease H3TH domain-containing protein, partial [Actinomycetota bacterium]
AAAGQAGSVAPQTPPAAPPGATAPARADLLAVDGDGLAHRAFYAEGLGGPVAGFLSLLAGVAERAPAEGLLIAFDSRERSYRRERYPAYKAQRAEKPPELEALLLTLPEAAAELGLAVAVAEGWEADDVVASAAAAAEAEGGRAVVATADRDALCLVSAATTVLALRGGGVAPVRVTPERLRRDLGIAPGQYLEFAALRGDRSDNLPGVHGIGPRRAAALLAAYPSVAEAVADPLGCRSVLGPEVGQALLDDLASGADSVFGRNVALMDPRRDLPVDLAAARTPPTAEHLAQRCAAWGLGRVAARLSMAVAARPEAPPPPPGPSD